MLKFIKTSLIAAILLPITSSIVIAEDMEKIIATVNNTKLTENDFHQYVSIRMGQQGHKHNQLTQVQRDALIGEFIDRELIYQDAITNEVDKDPEVTQQIKDQRRNVIVSYTVKQLIDKPPTNEIMRRTYKEHFSEPMTEFKARHILLKTEDQAKDVIKALEDGKDFDKLATEKSIDASAQQGGNLGWFGLEHMVKPFSFGVANLTKGEYTKIPVESEFGWHVIRLDDTRKGAPPEFGAVRERILSIVQNQTIKGYVAILRDNAEIKMEQ